MPHSKSSYKCDISSRKCDLSSCELDLACQLKSGDTKAAVDIFKSVGDHFRNDINAIWQRSQFFLASNLGLLAFFYSNAFDRSDHTSVVGLCIAGIVISLFWLAIAIVSFRWIDVWRNVLVDSKNQWLVLVHMLVVRV
jgi:hypothetical protein